MSRESENWVVDNQLLGEWFLSLKELLAWLIGLFFNSANYV